MTSVRKFVFANGYYYHVFNRGLDKRPTFITKKQLTRAKELLLFYQFTNLPMRFSQFKNLAHDKQSSLWEEITKQEQEVEIIAYCLMPNHFHFLLKQKQTNGVSSFVANFTNAYTKYFNTIYKRAGPLFQGAFKAVFVESEEQLLHLSRYIHLNPISSSLITQESLNQYIWSSYPEYLSLVKKITIRNNIILSMFKDISAYEKFVTDQINYAKELEKIKHLIIE